jgi:hypothetical protein
MTKESFSKLVLMGEGVESIKDTFTEFPQAPTKPLKMTVSIDGRRESIAKVMLWADGEIADKPGSKSTTKMTPRHVERIQHGCPKTISMLFDGIDIKLAKVKKLCGLSIVDDLEESISIVESIRELEVGSIKEAEARKKRGAKETEDLPGRRRKSQELCKKMIELESRLKSAKDTARELTTIMGLEYGRRIAGMVEKLRAELGLDQSLENQHKTREGWHRNRC